MKMHPVWRATSRVMGLAGAVVLLGSGASMLSGLRRVLRREKGAMREDEMGERERVREELADMLEEVDFKKWPDHVRRVRLPRDRKAYFQSLPRLDPPASVSVREDRDDRG